MSNTPAKASGVAIMAFHLSKNRFLNSNSMTSSFQIARIYTSSVTFLGKPHRRTSLTATGAQKFVKDLNEEERTLLMTALSKRNNFLAMQAGLPLVQQPSIQELYKLGKKIFSLATGIFINCLDFLCITISIN